MTPRSPLLEAVSAIRVDKDTRNRFTAKIAAEWTTQHSVLGGFLAALMLSATREFIALESPDRKFPDPIHVFVQFLHMVPPGAVSITCHPLRVSSRQAVVRVELSRKSRSDADGGPVTTAAIVTYGDLSRERGLSQEPKGQARAPALPDRQTECVQIDDPVVDATPVTSKLHWVAPRSADGLWGHRLGGHQREAWLSFKDGSMISDAMHLALLADMPLQPPATHEAGFYLKYALSTLCLSVEFKKRPDPTTRWVMTRSNSHKVSNGRYDVNLQIVDEEADILALSNHVVYVSELRARRKGMKM